MTLRVVLEYDDVVDSYDIKILKISDDNAQMKNILFEATFEFEFAYLMINILSSQASRETPHLWCGRRALCPPFVERNRCY